MTILFYFIDILVPLAISLICALLLMILIGPFWVFYLVFRDEEKRTVEVAKLRKFTMWLSLACTFIFAVGACLLRMEFGDDNYKLRLSLIMVISAALAFVSGVISLPHWQGILGILCFIIYTAFFINL